MLRRLWLAVPLLVLGISTVGWTAQPEGEQKTPAGIQETFAKLSQALNEHDLPGVMATYAPSGPVVMLGTGEGERWVGKEEIQSVYAGYFKEFDPGTQEIHCTWTMQDTQGALSWTARMCRITDFLKNQKREYGINVTAVLEKLEGQWYFRVLHTSVSNPNEEIMVEEN